MDRERLQRFVTAQDENMPAEEIMGGIDAVKLRSSMTLFARTTQLASPQKTVYSTGSRGLGEIGVFDEVLERFFDGEPDEATLGVIG